MLYLCAVMDQFFDVLDPSLLFHLASAKSPLEVQGISSDCCGNASLKNKKLKWHMSGCSTMQKAALLTLSLALE